MRALVVLQAPGCYAHYARTIQFHKGMTIVGVGRPNNIGWIFISEQVGARELCHWGARISYHCTEI